MLRTFPIALTTLALAVLFCASAFASRLVSYHTPKAIEDYETYIRQTRNEDLIRLIPRMVFYDSSSMPKMFQIDEFSGTFTGFKYSPPGGFREPNTDYPWAGPSGLNGAMNVRNFKFVVFPEPKGDKRIDEEKIRYWRENVPNANGNVNLVGSWAWQFPVGTIFGEVLTLKNPEGKYHTFEVRTRTKTAPGYKTGWSMESYRPFANAEGLLDRAQELAEGDHSTDKSLVTLISHLSNTKRALPERTFGSMANALESRTVVIDKLPAVSKEVVNALLATPFIPISGSYWIDHKKAPSAPSTDADYHIVPRGGDLAMVHVDSESCMSCHKTTLEHARRFQSIEWYGYVRGSDAIVSYNPFPGGGGIDNQLVKADLVKNVTGRPKN